MGGVIVVPLLAIYTLYSFVALPLFLASAAFAYVGIGVVQRRTLIHGRQRLLVCLLLGAVLPFANSLFFAFDAAVAESSTAVFFGTIIPGMAAYNFHAIDSEDRTTDLAICTVTLVSLLAVGVAFATPAIVYRLDPTFTSMLFTPASDIAHLRNVVRGSVMHTTSISSVVSFVLVFVGVTVGEVANARWGIRVGGLMAMPLLAIFALSNAWVVPVYLLGTVIVYLAIRLVNTLTLTYGRVLLTVGLVVGLLYGLAVAAFTTTVIGYMLFFTTILSGIGAYNFHQIAPAERVHAISVAGGLFALLLVGSQGFVTPDAAGVDVRLTSAAFPAVLLGVLFAGYGVYELEHRRRIASVDYARGVL